MNCFEYCFKNKYNKNLKKLKEITDDFKIDTEMISPVKTLEPIKKVDQIKKVDPIKKVDQIKKVESMTDLVIIEHEKESTQIEKIVIDEKYL